MSELVGGILRDATLISNLWIPEQWILAMGKSVPSMSAGSGQITTSGANATISPSTAFHLALELSAL